ncbi:MAG: outer membrane lipoprotein-sorting protein [Cellulophaga sp.]|nr:outer membrane lipoprotein-sorting protein [Cellulophaga sp.]
MKQALKLTALLFFLLTISCKETPKDEKMVQTEQENISEYHIPKNWIQNRVSKAEITLNATAAGKVVWNGMEAHGGLSKWYQNGYLKFRFDYQPLDGSTRRNTYQTIDTWSNKAKHTAYTDSTATFGWDGKEAWVNAKDSTAFKYDTKFWALTPLYLAAYPFILDGKGVQLQLLEEKEYKGKLQEVVKVTFDANVGDAPDDYYVLYFDKETHIISAIRYIVSYPEYFPDGGHSPEKIMEVVGHKETKGIVLPTGLKTHWLNEEDEMGEYITKIEISDVDFITELPEVFFSKPTNN